MKLEIKDVSNFKQIVAVLNTIVTDSIKIRIDPEQIKMQIMTIAGTVWVNLTIQKDFFSAYEVEQPLDYAIVVNDLHYIMRKTRANDVITIEEKDNQFAVTLEGNSKRVYNLPIIDTEYQFKETSMDFPLKIVCDSTLIADDVNDASDIVVKDCGPIIFTNEGEKLQIASSDKLRTVNIDVNNVQYESISNEIGRFASQIMAKVMEARKIAAEVTIEYKTNHPMRLTYSQEHVELKLLIAPRVEQK